MNKSVLIAVVLMAGLTAGYNASVPEPFESPYSTGLLGIQSGVNANNVRLIELQAEVLNLQGLVRAQRDAVASSREFVITWAVALSLAFGIVNYYFWTKLVLRAQQERFKLEAMKEPVEAIEGEFAQ